MTEAIVFPRPVASATRLRFLVPGPPVPCERPRVVRFGKGQNGFVRTITPARTEAFQTLVQLHARSAMAAARWPVGGAGPFAVRVEVYREANRGDLDNFVKSAIDGMSRAQAWDDDRHVLELAAVMHIDRERPRMLLEVRLLEASA